MPEKIKKRKAHSGLAKESRMTIKKRTKAATQIVKARTPEIVWGHEDFEREVEKAKKIGPKKMSNEDLVSFCHGVNGYFHAHFWADSRPFFVELWRRINSGKLKMSKTEACRQIGCSRQWANEVVSGRADERRELRAKAKGAKTGKKVSTTILTDEDYVHEIREHAFAKLEPLRKSQWDRYRKVCAELAKQFDEASKTPPAGKARAAGAVT
jgi:hypothetical protein